jgi:hypothetical protein
MSTTPHNFSERLNVSAVGDSRRQFGSEITTTGGLADRVCHTRAWWDQRQKVFPGGGRIKA